MNCQILPTSLRRDQLTARMAASAARLVASLDALARRTRRGTVTRVPDQIAGDGSEARPAVRVGQADDLGVDAAVAGRSLIARTTDHGTPRSSRGRRRGGADEGDH